MHTFEAYGRASGLDRTNEALHGSGLDRSDQCLGLTRDCRRSAGRGEGANPRIGHILPGANTHFDQHQCRATTLGKYLR